MTDFSFPEKPDYNFTKKQMLERKKVLKHKVEHIKFKDLKNKNELIEAYSKSSFQARKIGEGAKLYEKELNRGTTTVSYTHLTLPTMS